MAARDGTDGELRVHGAAPGGPALRFHGLSRPGAGQQDDPVREFTVSARCAGLRAEVVVRTWAGDGLDGFLAGLAEGFRGWAGVRGWRSMERDLTLGAVHTGSRVLLTWGLHAPLPDDDWHAEVTTDHEPGEGMRRLALGVRAFLAP